MLKAFLLSLCLIATATHAESIQYEIYKMEDNGIPTLITSGTRTYSDKDFKIKKSQNTVLDKSLELEQGFYIGIASDSGDTKGFGLWAKKNPRDFSWEWFDLTSLGQYTKRQEVGHLTASGTDKEISSLHFDTDISLRIKNFDTNKYTHRILIKQNSILQLPPAQVE